MFSGGNQCGSRKDYERKKHEMKRMMERGLPWLALWLVAGCTGPPPSVEAPAPGLPDAPADEPAEAAAATIWEGVYTAEQADSGHQIALANCFECHSADEWRGPGFLRLWEGRRLGDLYERIRRTMPQNDPGRLTEEEYADIVAYMLGLQDVPTGDGQRELPSDLEVLDAIFFTPAKNQ